MEFVDKSELDVNSELSETKSTSESDKGQSSLDMTEKSSESSFKDPDCSKTSTDVSVDTHVTSHVDFSKDAVKCTEVSEDLKLADKASLDTAGVSAGASQPEKPSVSSNSPEITRQLNNESVEEVLPDSSAILKTGPETDSNLRIVKAVPNKSSSEEKSGSNADDNATLGEENETEKEKLTSLQNVTGNTTVRVEGKTEMMSKTSEKVIDESSPKQIDKNVEMQLDVYSENSDQIETPSNFDSNTDASNVEIVIERVPMTSNSERIEDKHQPLTNNETDNSVQGDDNCKLNQSVSETASETGTESEKDGHAKNPEIHSSENPSTTDNVSTVTPDVEPMDCTLVNIEVESLSSLKEETKVPMEIDKHDQLEEIPAQVGDLHGESSTSTRRKAVHELGTGFVQISDSLDNNEGPPNNIQNADGSSSHSGDKSSPFTSAKVVAQNDMVCHLDTATTTECETKETSDMMAPKNVVSAGLEADTRILERDQDSDLSVEFCKDSVQFTKEIPEAAKADQNISGQVTESKVPTNETELPIVDANKDVEANNDKQGIAEKTGNGDKIEGKDNPASIEDCCMSMLQDDSVVVVDDVNETSKKAGIENFKEGLADKDCRAIEKLTTDQASVNEKPLITIDEDDEVCIVPDTQPREPTEKEKADAFEKAGKSLEAAEEMPEKVVETEGKKESGVTEKSTASKVESKAPKERKADNVPESRKRKFGIQVVSTSSLVSKSDVSEKEKKASEILESRKAQDELQTADIGDQTCAGCGKLTKCKYEVRGKHLCEDECYTNYRKANGSQTVKALIRPRNLQGGYTHKCGECCRRVDPKLEKSLSWETMDFCSVECLEKYQKTLGSHCANCKASVTSTSLGKYCVRFGYDMKQFCSAICLEDFKKGLKVCSYCQKDISGVVEGFLAPVGDKGQFKDFCTQECMEKYDHMSHNITAPEESQECAVCNEVKVVKVQILLDSKVQKLCSEPCFAAYKFVNNLVTDQCDMCRKYYNHDRSENYCVFYDEAPHTFCCKTCMNVYILAKRKIIPCSWCKVKKYNFDMIKKLLGNGLITLNMCSLHCLNLYSVNQAALADDSAYALSKKTCCEHCNSSAATQYHLTMSDASVRNFCTSACVLSFQQKFPKISSQGVDKTPYPLGLPRKVTTKKMGTLNAALSDKEHGSNSPISMPVISSVQSLAPGPGQILSPPPSLSPSPSAAVPVTVPSKITAVESVRTVYKQQFIIRPPPHPEMLNCAVQVKPKMLTKSVSCRPLSCSVETQTDDSMGKPVFIPVPVPIYIPTPVHMYTSPYPVPIPIVLPIPVPIFLPTTRNSAKGIFKEIKRIQENIPSDPCEAELLMMAEMVANDKKEGKAESESEGDDDDVSGNGAPDGDASNSGNAAEGDFGSENVVGGIGDDVFQMALKMASELDEPAVNFEASVAPTRSASTAPTQAQPTEERDDSEEDETEEHVTQVKKKMSCPTTRSPSANLKHGRKSSTSDLSTAPAGPDPKVFPNSKETLVEKPDANMCLKFTLGVNAWKSWVNQKNAELEKAGSEGKKVKLFNRNLLQLTADELNYSLCLFVKEVRKPNGDEYAPDTIFYLCLGIQQYLIENARVDNIFCDPYYEKFTECLDEVAKRFPLQFSGKSEYFITRVVEEHLWESKQLGAHSPYVLLSTLMFFNTKHFSLTTVEEHMQLSFTHIMKHWKRQPPGVAPGGPKGAGSKNVLLRFYPPQSALASNSKKKRMYEQQENEDNALRCPVKLYEFYLSKCPERVRTRNDVFYLLPERSCVPESPVWYSTMSLGNEQLQKMLNRIKMVKELII